MEVRVYGGGDMLALLENTNPSLWVPPSPSFHETMVNFDQDPQLGRRPSAKRDRNGQLTRSSDGEDTGGEDYKAVPYLQGEKKRRLSPEQVTFLEKSFEVDNKLEPERKVQLAKELGLQPRQIAIWFQNRRARYKTKQLEKDYDALKASYDRLKVDYDSLCKEKDYLLNEVKVLTKKLKQIDGASDALDNDVFLSDNEPPEMENVKMENLMEVPSTKQLAEDANSAKSDVFDSESPRCTDGNNSSLVEDTEQQSEFLKEEADKFRSKGDLTPSTTTQAVAPTLPAFNNFLEIEDEGCYDDPSSSSCNFSLVDDQPFLSWLY